MPIPTSFDQEYELASGRLGALGKKTEGLIRDLIDIEGVNIHSVGFRVKPKESCLRKLQSLGSGHQFSNLTDALGIRIITYFREDVDMIAKLIEREFLVDPENSVDKSALLDADRFGYLSVHYIAQIGRARARLAEYRDYRDIKFEIQIRSILQHSWAEIEHDLGYKSVAAVPKPVRRRFSRLASLLELADDEFIAIRNELSSHQQNSREIIGKGNLDIEIDQDSIYTFAQSDSRVAALDAIFVDSMGRPRNDDVPRSYYGKIVEDFIIAQFHTIRDVSEFINLNSKLLESFIREWIPIFKDTWDKDDERKQLPIPAGMSLHFVYLLKLPLLEKKGMMAYDSYTLPGVLRTSSKMLDRALKTTNSEPS
jgi:ppGpp synthetase/RelA/SpoT-type nucleotidyltranferase